MGRNRGKKRKKVEDENGTVRSGDRPWAHEVPGSSVMFVPSKPRGSAVPGSSTKDDASALHRPAATSPMPSTSAGNSAVQCDATKFSRCDASSKSDVKNMQRNCGKWQRHKQRHSSRHTTALNNCCSSQMGYNLSQKGNNSSKTGHRFDRQRGKQHCPSQFQSNHQQSHDKTREGKICAGGTSTSTDSSLDIPGFYYDTEKQKYFKILPTAGNANAVTKETIAKNKAEVKRQADLKSFGSPIKSAMQPASTSVKSATKKKNTCVTVGSVFFGAYQRGEVDRYRLPKLFTCDTASSLKPAGCAEVFPGVQGPHEKLEHMHQMETSHDHKKILCLWSVKGSMVQRLQLVTLREAQRTCTGHLSLEFDPSGTTVMQSWNKITNMCWADFTQDPSKKYVLYTTMCHTGQAYSLAFIRNLDPGYRDNVHFSDFNLGTKATWTCAWNSPKQQFSVGTEKGCLVIDVTTRRLWQFKTHNSDALAQVFSKEDGGNLMYTGTRRGQILLHDLRSNSTFPTTLMSHKSSLACLRLSADETYLYASDFSGKINKWDVRMRGNVLSYDGLYNQYAKLPFYIDETESILYGAGQDCYSKIFSLDTGKLLLSIPPPCQASRDTIPALQFSTHWADNPGNAGLIMGVTDKFYLYGSGMEDESCDRKIVTDNWHNEWISVITTN